MGRRVVTVFGGSGFLGRHVVRRLASEGAIVRVAVRDPEAANFLKPLGEVGQVVPMAADVTDPASVADVVRGASEVVNLVGILFERGRRTFQRVHAEGAANVAKAARDAGVQSFVHISAIGADRTSASGYAKTKAFGEEAVKETFPATTILRPSVVFGPEDGFFNMFASLARFTPVLPVFGCPFPPTVKLFHEGALVDIDIYGDGGTKFQPVYVGDVAKAVTTALGNSQARGRTFELGGPRVYSFKEIMDLLLKQIGRRRLIVPLPFWVGRFEALFLEMLPKPLLTRDQVTLLETDNVVWERALTLSDLGIEATAAEAILPTYLHRYRPQKHQILRVA